jgi:hypothetical protein
VDKQSAVDVEPGRLRLACVALGCLLAAAVMLLPAVARADNVGPLFAKTVTTGSSSPFTGTACTSLTATDGVSLDGVSGYSVTVSAASGQTLSGGGSVQCCVYKAVSSTGAPGPAPTKRWMACDAAFHFTPAASVRDYTAPEFEALVGGGRLYYRAAAVTTSGGTTLDITIQTRRDKP